MGTQEDHLDVMIDGLGKSYSNQQLIVKPQVDSLTSSSCRVV